MTELIEQNSSILDFNNELFITIEQMSVLFTFIENTNDNDLINEINGRQ
jgi:hypothetical protein